MFLVVLQLDLVGILQIGRRHVHDVLDSGTLRGYHGLEAGRGGWVLLEVNVPRWGGVQLLLVRVVCYAIIGDVRQLQLLVLGIGLDVLLSSGRLQEGLLLGRLVDEELSLRRGRQLLLTQVQLGKSVLLGDRRLLGKMET